MAPTTSSILLPSSSPSNRHRLRHQTSSVFHHPPGQSSRVHRLLDTALQPSLVPEGLPPPPIVPAPSESVVVTPEPSVIPVSGNQPQGPNQPEDIPGNIVAVVVVIILVLGGLIGLVTGGEMLRRRARTTGERLSAPPSRPLGRQKSKSIKSVTGLQQERVKLSREKFSYDEKTLTPLARPPPVLNRERQRRLTDVWPIRSLSRVLYNRRSSPAQVERSLRRSGPPLANPQTTWSEFSPVSLYVPPPRTILARIPEELEDCENKTNSESNSVVWARRTKVAKSSHDMLAEDLSGSESSVIAGRRSPDFQITRKAAARDEDSKSVGSSAPDMTSDEDDSSRSSIASLDSLEDKNDRESLREEVFELRRAQTRSMQMNKGVLLSLSLHSTLNNGQNLESTDGKLSGCGPSRLPCAPDTSEGGKDCIERELSLAMLGGSFSAVNLDEFPSPPSILPVIPSFVSGF